MGTKGKGPNRLDRRGLAGTVAKDNNFEICPLTGFLKRDTKQVRKDLTGKFGWRGDLRCFGKKCTCEADRQAAHERIEKEREDGRLRRVRQANGGAHGMTRVGNRGGASREETAKYLGNQENTSNNVFAERFAAIGVDAVTSTHKLGKKVMKKNGGIATIIVAKK